MKKYKINGEIIETNNLKKEYPHLFKSYTYVWETKTGKTYLLVNDYVYRKPHYFTEYEKEFFSNIYGGLAQVFGTLGAEEKVVPAGNLENGIYTISKEHKAEKVA